MPQLSFHQCCASIIDNAAARPLSYAVGYAKAGLAIDDTHAQRVQALYLLNNIQYWRGPLAKTVRESLRAMSQ